mmetsp:Transcript_72732/g.173324  ORF Transcript_72732/g.173324 Transcript_72732/m.173324 type:complete len:215 (+) Transcript_72732:760-1404(+)
MMTGTTTAAGEMIEMITMTAGEVTGMIDGGMTGAVVTATMTDAVETVMTTGAVATMMTTDGGEMIAVAMTMTTTGADRQEEGTDAAGMTMTRMMTFGQMAEPARANRKRRTAPTCWILMRHLPHQRLQHLQRLLLHRIRAGALSAQHPRLQQPTQTSATLPQRHLLFRRRHVEDWDSFSFRRHRSSKWLGRTLEASKGEHHLQCSSSSSASNSR